MKIFMILILFVTSVTFAVQVITMKPIREYKEIPTTNTSLYHLVFGVSITIFGCAGYGPPIISPMITIIGILGLMCIMRVLKLPGMIVKLEKFMVTWLFGALAAEYLWNSKYRQSDQ
jgi:hypothetical protein